MSLPEITEAIHRGYQFLESQLEETHFVPNLSSTKPHDFSQAVASHTVFPQSLILSCLSCSHQTSLLPLKNQLANFLLDQKSPHWSFNYWAKNSEESRKTPYPDDLDVTFCTLSALFLYRPSLINGEVLAKAVALLTNLEIKEGGPYRTWLVTNEVPEVWKDVDLAVNANIAFFFSLQGINLPNLKTLIEERIEQKNFSSPYYFGELPVVYFISRFYRGKKKKKIAESLFRQKKEGKIGKNPLAWALYLSSLLNLGYKVEVEDIRSLLSLQKEDGWSAEAFVIESKRGQKTFYSGSAALTTAFCLEALEKYLQETRTSGKETRSLLKEKNQLYREIILQLKNRFSQLPKDLEKEALRWLDFLVKKDKDQQRALMPYLFAWTLGKRAKKLEKQFLLKLGMANLCGWLAYTIYDNFLDKEGSPQSLPVANVALRELTKTFTELLPQTDWPKIFQKIMDEMEGANNWEVKYTHLISLKNNLPKWGQDEKLAQRSLGHALGPLAILFYLGYGANSPEVRALITFFKHFLIAKQLNDDAHDWEKDLKRGQATPVVTLLLKKTSPKTEEISQLIPELRKLFWEKEVDYVCRKIIYHCRLARKALRGMKLVAKPQFLKSILVPLEQAAQKTQREKRQMLSFIKNYSPPKSISKSSTKEAAPVAAKAATKKILTAKSREEPKLKLEKSKGKTT